ncbi:MAG TPA: ABC transporter substrate-binding protein [Paenirhodobacter sp.]
MKMVLSTILAALMSTAAPAAFAADLVIGARNEVQMDPHFTWTDSNIAYYDHIYGALVDMGIDQQIKPSIAVSWTTLTPTKWRFEIQPKAVFSNGKPVTSADVVASFERVRTIKASSPFTGAIPTVVSVTADGDKAVIVETSTPTPLLLQNLVAIQIVPAEDLTATAEDFASGKAAIGAGPYKIESYTASNSLTLVRNEHYWGEPAKWDKVTFRFLPNDAARVAALLAGDVDLIDFVPPNAVAKLAGSAGIEVERAPSGRVAALSVDAGRNPSPQVTDMAGKPLAKNPFADVRVRKALSLAVNRDAMVSRIMNGYAFPAGQLAPATLPGYNPAIPVPAFDLVQAKQLLNDAGYGDGFAFTLSCTNDRYVNDGLICQALGQMFTQLGLKVAVETMPASVFFARANIKKDGGVDFSAMLTAWADSVGEAQVLQAVVHTYDPVSGLGAYNRSYYSNPPLDKLIEATVSEMDAATRHTEMANAMAVAMDDVALIPLHYQSVITATRGKIGYTPWTTEMTMADSAFVKN